MNLKLTLSFLLSAAFMLVLLACGDTQTADTPTPESKIVATMEVEPSPTKEPLKPKPTSPPAPKLSPTKTAATVAAMPAPTATFTPTPPPTPLPTATFTPTPSPTPPPVGRVKTNPMPAGSTVTTDDGLAITVMSVDADAWPEVQAENMFNDPPKEGYRFIFVELRVQVVDGSFTNETSISNWDFGAVGSSAVVFETYGCGVIPNELSATMFQGGITQGNLCIEVPEDETDLLVFYTGGLFSTANAWLHTSQL